VRDVFRGTLVEAAANPDFVFLTGDLGYKALEPLRDAMGERFINAGVAEQNMVSVAAGLARLQFRPWVYSIAPFMYARPFEQIRNDVCLHHLPVILVGNGGGYGYGVMGSTHHAIEDYGSLLTLPYLRAFVPAFDGDVRAMVPLLMRSEGPVYLRLGVSEEPTGFLLPEYAPWRRLLRGNGPTMVVTGPLVGGILAVARELPEARRPDLWLVSELPIDRIPDEFLESAARSQHVIAVEEHRAAGGLGQMLVHRMACLGKAPARFTHQCALGYVSGLYGSQKFHRRECGLDPASIMALLHLQ
jgi:transketolase